MHPTTNPPTPPSDSGKPEGFAASAGSSTTLALPPSSPSSAFLSESDLSEERRLQALERYGLLETPAVTAFDRITKLAARCLVAPVAFVAWVDREGVRLGSRQGIDLESINLDWGAMVDGIRPMAVNRVHERLVLDAIAKEKELVLDEEKFEQFLAMAAAQQGTSSLALRQRLDQDGRLESLRAQLLRDQTVAHLLGEEDEAGESEDSGDEE